MTTIPKRDLANLAATVAALGLTEADVLADGADALDLEELSVCKKMHIAPADYLRSKDAPASELDTAIRAARIARDMARR